MEKITSIEEVTGVKFDSDDWSEYAGYKIVTDKQTIFFAISNNQQCCENWGYLMSNDNLDDFIDANLISIGLVDEELKTALLDDEFSTEASCMFVNVETSKGLLQFVAYNDHNGYYGHHAVVVSNQLKFDTTL